MREALRKPVRTLIVLIFGMVSEAFMSDLLCGMDRGPLVISNQL